MSMQRDVDVVVVGAGFAGLYLLYRLRSAGWSIQGFEAGGGVGGTWYWNRYPGARCDIESVEYSYDFDDDLQQEWEWSERYASQPEILRYLEHVADRFDLRKHIQFDTRVVAANYDEASSRWTVTTDAGDTVTARFVVMATGCLSSANLPDIPGRDDFAGEMFHTGRWPHEGVDFTGQRVGVIGTGSSAVQSIPIIAEQADHLVVFQRTPAYTVPAHNGPLDHDYVKQLKADYASFRAANRQMGAAFGSRVPEPEPSALAVAEEERVAAYERRWEYGGLSFLGAYADLLLDANANDTIAEFVRGKIRSIVRNPEVAEMLMPRQVLGCKRLCVDSGYYATYNRDNVQLVDISKWPIVRITPDGVETAREHIELDSLVFATGFDAMTGALLRVDIRGRDGATLQEEWAAGPRTYLGLGVHKFPNLFIVTGPGSPSVLTNMVVSIQQHVEWIDACLRYMRDNGVTAIEASQESADQWVDYVNTVASFTLFPTCNSWYLGANIPGKTRVFMPLPGFPTYVAQCDDVAAHDYRGFELTRR